MKKRKKYQYGDPVQDAIKKGLIQPPVDEYAPQEPYVSPNLMGNMTMRNTVQGPLPFDHTVSKPNEFAAYDFHPAFKYFNAAAQLTTGIANKVNDFKNTKDENQQYLRMLQSRPYENFNEEGLNNLPVYTKFGGGNSRIIEAEEGEVYQTPDGILKKVDEGAGTHEEGGVIIKDAERVLEDTSDKRKDKDSQALKLTSEQAENLTGYRPKGEVSHSKAMELAKKDINKQTNQFQSKIKKNVEFLEQSKNNPFATNSLKFNMLNLSTVPTEGEVFDNLFAHQETIKQVMDINNTTKAQFGTGYSRPPRINKGRYFFDEATQKWYKNPTTPPVTEGFSTPETGYTRPPRINNGDYVFNEATQRWHPRSAGTPETMASTIGPDTQQVANPNDLVPYAGGRTHAGRTTPTGYDNAFNFEGGLEPFKDAWSSYVDLSQYKNASDAQGAIYDYLSQNAPQAVDAMWNQYGLTNLGRRNADKLKAAGIELAPNPKTGVLDFKDYNSLNAEQKRLLGSLAYNDNDLGTRTMLPGSMGVDVPNPPMDGPVPPAAAPPVASNPPAQAQRRFNFNQPKSGFNEPLRWYDVAGPIQAISEGRIPAHMNPVEYNQVRLKLQNPLPSLQAGQSSYNSALQTLPSNSQGYANTANLFAKKYGIDNQVLGQYENINTGIKNQETLYNANVRDRQSTADQQSRELFEQKYLGSKEAQREQNLTGWDSLYTRIAQNRKLNREGNLLMKLFPAFDQYAEHNGYQPYFRMPNNIPNTGLTPPTGINTAGAQVIQKQEPQYYITIGGKQYPWKPPKKGGK